MFYPVPCSGNSHGIPPEQVRYRTLMSDDAMKAAVEAAYRRLHARLSEAGASASSDAVRRALQTTLEGLRQRIDADPQWLDEIIRSASVDDVPARR